MKEKIILDWEVLGKKLTTWQQMGHEVVFTNGCFDVLHVGHIHYLAEAKSLGKYLVVGINGDDSVRRLKGADRPYNHQMDRALLLAALEMVDAVTIFDQDTPLELITHLSPDLLVKGGDYTVDQIVGAAHVLSRGGQVHSLQFVEGYSTSKMAEKIKLS